MSHFAIFRALESRGFPNDFVKFVENMYTKSTTILEVDDESSANIVVKRGVRQGDPLSSPIFCIVADDLLKAIPEEVGYFMDDCKINATAYADDINIITASSVGMQRALRALEEEGEKRGLRLNKEKCSSISVKPAGRVKKLKIITEAQFQFSDGSYVKQLKPSESMKYLGIFFDPRGIKKCRGDLDQELKRISRAPLKPQQRLKVLRSFLVPRWYYKLSLSRINITTLREMDKNIRGYVKKWLNMPKDIPISYIHANCKDGGLGIPSFTTTIPYLIYSRFNKLKESNSDTVRKLYNSSWIQNRIKWAHGRLWLDGEYRIKEGATQAYWRRKLYDSVDGADLKECFKTSINTRWLDANSNGIPGRDYIQYNHIRINALPTRSRTSRGIRSQRAERLCRAGCDAVETATHVIQNCFRTHGGRIKRHDAVSKTLANGLRQKNWKVEEKNDFQTSEGLRKPDLVCMKDGVVWVIDTQVVGHYKPLNELHKDKIKKYRKDEIRDAIVTQFYKQNINVLKENINFSSCTISYRGIWSQSSEEDLLSLGLTKGLLSTLTTMSIQGSHTNWTRWNKMTNRLSTRRT